ncbi:flagellar assembly protein FliX [Siccirubricoccus phaeus]|uniref:flagellar assembly protein FliX n=1 Tax=Siccirubricoccus phaeus TaxID=2595053 RepID=UPI00165BF999|nr:flagellar assembly protein FliX [Siccirubricoccus phaeus]
MRGVGGVGGPGPVSGKRGPGRAGASGFAVPAGGAAASARAEAAAAAAPLGLLALQEQGAERRRDAAARRRATSLLEELNGLQRELLDGRPDPERLRRLAALQQGDAAEDPALQEALEGILLRSRIELARRGWEDSLNDS